MATNKGQQVVFIFFCVEFCFGFVGLKQHLLIRELPLILVLFI